MLRAVVVIHPPGLGGVIDIFDPNTLTFLGTLNNPDGTPIMIPGLWGLQFGNTTAGGPNEAGIVFDPSGRAQLSYALFASGATDPAVRAPSLRVLLRSVREDRSAGASPNRIPLMTHMRPQ